MPLNGVVFVIILDVLHDAQTDLLQVGQARRAARSSRARANTGKKDCRQDRYDGNNDKQFGSV